MPVKKVAEDKALRFTYEITRDEKFKRYIIGKYDSDGQHTETYHVYIPYKGHGTEETEEDNVFCDCMGFQRQKYAAHLHKHILLVKQFMESGRDVGLYKLDKNHNITDMKKELP